MPLKCASGRLFNNWYTYRNYWRVCSIDRVCPRRMHTDNFDPRLRSYLMKTKLELIDRSTHQETNKDSREIQHHELHMLGQLADRLSLCEEEFHELKNMAKGEVFPFTINRITLDNFSFPSQMMMSISG